jgi:hypothetical protein
MLETMRIAAGRLRLLLAVAVLAWPTVVPASDAARPAIASESAAANPGAASARPAPSVPSSLAGQQKRANFFGEVASSDARRVADWVVSSADNDGLPFIVIDKVQAKVFVFDSVGRLRGATLALLGRARGDDAVPGIGSRKLKTIRPEERTTPAGRFVAFLGRDLETDVLWIDYDLSVSLHRVITGDPGDHRLQRLATTSALDKRISYGCINVPVRFYEDVVLGTFTGVRGIAYVLPEIKTIQDVFPMAYASADAPRR